MSDPIARLNTALEGRYRVDRQIGEGGMATVYLAEDVRHEREVALKVLKPDLAAVVGSDRFLSEIKTTANLHHPHILPLFDSGEVDELLFYVMPYVQGDSLQERLAREKQLPVDETVRIVTAVANALQAAHERGVVHRDIKPANILLRRGEPLVSDFGIALAVGAAGGDRLTETGLSLGTPFYMSPEQATGDRVVGPPSDIYSLGCVLYEMLVGDPPFVGSSAQAVLGKIIQGTPAPPTEARPSIPANVESAMMQALERVPADRFTSASNFAEALANPSFRHGASVAAAPDPRGSRRIVPALGATTVLFAAVAAWALLRPPPPREVGRFMLDLPEGQEVSETDRDRLAMTPDGRQLVYVGSNGLGGTQLWVRAMDRISATPIQGTEGAATPAISPDGSQVAFTTFRGTTRELRVVPLEGGPSLLVTDSLVDPGGLAWGHDGFIYMDGHLEGDGFARVRETGGLPEQVTVPESLEQWHSHPRPLPNGRGILFFAFNPPRIGVVDLETREYEFLTQGVAALYSPTGHLVWVTPDGTLTAAPFDQDRLRLTGPEIPLESGLVTSQFGGSNLALSEDGTLVYMAGRRGNLAELGFLDPAGGFEPLDPPWQGDFQGMAVSPDGTRLAASIIESGSGQIWVRNIQGGGAAQITFDGDNRWPTWSADGKLVLYTSARNGSSGVYRRDPDALGEDSLVLLLDVFDPVVSRDGEWLVVATGTSQPSQRASSLLAYPLDSDGMPDGDPVRISSPRIFSGLAAISPDSRWIAFVEVVNADLPQVFVRPFPNVNDGLWPVSEGWGVYPMWSDDGTELSFFDFGQHRLSTVPVFEGPTFRYGEAREQRISDVDASSGPGERGLAKVPGQPRYLLERPIASNREQVVLVQNFFEVLKERVGGP